MRVLLSEDDDEMREYLAIALRGAGHDVTTCADGAAMVDHLGAVLADEDKYELVVSDIRMPGLGGLEVLEELFGWPGLPPVVLITSFGDRQTIERARELGARAVLNKPFDTQAFLDVVREAEESA